MPFKVVVIMLALKSVTPSIKEEICLGSSMKTYRQATSWLESVNEGHCPDCGHAIVQMTRTHKCKSCQFSIIGNPRYLAYIHKDFDEFNPLIYALFDAGKELWNASIKINNKKFNLGFFISKEDALHECKRVRKGYRKYRVVSLLESQCIECGSTDLKEDDKHDQLYCGKCGLVLRGPPEYKGNIKVNYPFGDSFNWEINWGRSGHNFVGWIH